MKRRSQIRQSEGTSRAEQLRRAKQAQRRREGARGLADIQLKLPTRLAARLRLAAREPDFADALDRWLDDLVVSTREFPALASIAWNRAGEWIPAREAFALYERNWRFVELAGLEPHERSLIERLAARFGNGLINV